MPYPTHFAINFWLVETLFAATVTVSVIPNGTSSLAKLCCIQARDMHKVSWGRWGKVSQMTFLSLVDWNGSQGTYDKGGIIFVSLF